MNAEIEKEIVRYFIRKDRQDRIAWELQSKRKRDSIMWKLCDTRLFEKEVLYPQPYLSPKDLAEKLTDLGAQKTIYIISFYEMSEPKEIALCWKELSSSMIIRIYCILEMDWDTLRECKK